MFAVAHETLTDSYDTNIVRNARNPQPVSHGAHDAHRMKLCDILWIDSHDTELVGFV